MSDPLLTAFADNQLLFEAVRDAILKQFSMDSTEKLQGLDDKSLGEVMRARINGLQKVEAAFREIASHRTAPERKELTNQAR